METLLWDFDGTLGSREGMWSGTLLSLLMKNGYTKFKLEDIRPFLNIGFSWDSPDSAHKDLFKGKTWWEYHESYLSEVFQKIGISKKKAYELSKEVKLEYMDSSKWFLFENSKKILEEAHNKGYTNYILSNHIPELSEIIKNLGIYELFEDVFCSAKIGWEKPNPHIYNYVIESLKIKKEKCIMIGDNYGADIAGSLRAGIKAILVRKENIKNYKYYSKDLSDLFEVMKNIKG